MFDLRRARRIKVTCLASSSARRTLGRLRFSDCRGVATDRRRRSARRSRALTALPNRASSREAVAGPELAEAADQGVEFVEVGRLDDEGVRAGFQTLDHHRLVVAATEHDHRRHAQFGDRPYVAALPDRKCPAIPNPAGQIGVDDVCGTCRLDTQGIEPRSAVSATVTMVPGDRHKALRMSLACPRSSSTTRTIFIPAVVFLCSSVGDGSSPSVGANSLRQTRTLLGASMPNLTSRRRMDRTLTVMSEPILTRCPIPREH